MIYDSRSSWLSIICSIRFPRLDFSFLATGASSAGFSAGVSAGVSTGASTEATTGDSAT